MLRAALAAGAVAGALVVPGCAPAAAEQEASVTVFAAASLTGVFTELADRFEGEHPGTRVELSFAGSSDLAVQLVEGAPADVFASADEATMQRIADAGLLQEPTASLATNALEIAVPVGNPARIASFADLADATVVICAPQVPCGAATHRVEQATGVTLSPVSEEPSVTSVLGKVAAGEADAGLVYRTDVLAAEGRVEGVPLPESSGAVNHYLIARTGDSDLARDFVDFALGPEGREVLDAAGFGAP